MFRVLTHPAALRAIIDAVFQPDAPRGADAALPGTPRADQVMAARTAAGEEVFLQVACYPHTTEATGDQAGRRGDDTALLVV
ncbi:MAG: hypothetical protein LC769_05270, partial [Chloroflexi bacterium]|nr:hypothetical protein [Chloroflexota bacterium]